MKSILEPSVVQLWVKCYKINSLIPEATELLITILYKEPETSNI